MRQKPICLLLTGALALSLTACAPAGEGPNPTPTPSPSVPASSEPSGPALAVPTTEPSNPPSEMPVDSLPTVYRIPDRDYQPWQVAYMDFLTLLQTHKTTWEPGGEGAQVGSESYSLYDVDKDGVPELFVKFGTCEADFFARCYTLYRDNSGRDVVVMAAQFPFGHSALYTCPDKNGFLRHEGHMGYAELYEYGPLADGEMPQEREIFSEENVREYTPTDEIVPGAEYIPSYRAQLGEWHSSWREDAPKPSDGKALLLPICDWGVGPAATGSDPEEARTAILAALNGEAELYGACGDGFYGDTGRITWEKYVQPGAACPYNDEPFQITKHVWQDLNGDGQEECALWLEAEERICPRVTVLSAQGGQVYAYYFEFYDEVVLYADGTFRGTWRGDVRLSFWRDQCYEYAVQGDPSARPVKWVDGSPAG